MKTIFSEEPKNDVWRKISRYTYRNNIERYFDKHKIDYENESIFEKITCALQQSKEYFNASENTSLHISPLLIYYGLTNLMIGILMLKTGKDVNIKEHGMRVVQSDDTKLIGDVQIKIINPETGALSVLGKAYNVNEVDFNSYNSSLKDLLSLVPEIENEFYDSYGESSNVFYVNRIVNENGYFERISIVDELSKNKFLEFTKSKLFKQSYIMPRFHEGSFIVNRRLNSDDCGVYTISSKKYLCIPQCINGDEVRLNIIVIYFMLLFALSYLSRYRPLLWYNFVHNDQSGEREIIEKLVLKSQREIPNYIYNFLENEVYNFSNEKDKINDVRANKNEKEIEEMIINIVNRKMHGGN